MKRLRQVIIVILLLTASACSKKDSPTEIPFTDYSLTESSCAWQSYQPNKLIVINSNDELSSYVQCTGSLPDIDFSKYTLLLTRGTSTSGISRIDKLFLQHSGHEYWLKVNIKLNITTVVENWSVHILVPKLPSTVRVMLDVTQAG